MSSIILSNTNPVFLQNPPVGSTLFFSDLSGRMATLNSSGVTSSIAFLGDVTGGTGSIGPQGLQGITGATGPQGPAGGGGTSFNDWVAIGTQIQQGPFALTQSVFFELPFDGSGTTRPGSSMGTTASNGFGVKLSEAGSGTGRAYKIMCAADIEAGNSKVIALRLRVYERANPFSSWSPTDVLLSECRASTGTSFAKTFTEWIYVPSNQDEEVVATVANMTDNGSLTIDRIKMVVTDLGPVS